MVAETWWTWKQAVQYVLANHPCEDLRIADGLLRCFVMGDTFPVRWRLHTHHGTMVPISGRDWVRHLDIGPYLGEDLEQHLFQTHGNGEVVLGAAAVQRLCVRNREAGKPGPDGLGPLIDAAAQAVFPPNGRRPAGMLKRTARELMSDYIANLGYPRPDHKTYRRHGR
jgi:hypothetical protein